MLELIAKGLNTRTEFSSSETQRALVEALEHEINAEKQLEEDNLGGTNPPNIEGFAVEKKDAEVRLTKTYDAEK